MRTIMSIQSSVAYGHVGNSAATFPLMRRGVEVWPVLTVHFSNHTGYPDWRGPMLAADDVREVVAGIADRGVLDRCDAVLSGYQGTAEVGAVILEAVAAVRAANPDAVYCCDPVLGDEGRGVYVRPGLTEFIRDEVVPQADLLTPNQFELELLTGRQVEALADVLDAADALRRRGPQLVLVTSVHHDQTEAETLEMVVVDAAGAWSISTPRLAQDFTGTGDLTAAMFLAGWLETHSAEDALQTAAASVFGVLQATFDLGERELALVAAQDELAAPTRTFPITRLR